MGHNSNIEKFGDTRNPSRNYDSFIKAVRDVHDPVIDPSERMIAKLDYICESLDRFQRQIDIHDLNVLKREFDEQIRKAHQ